MPRHKGWSRSRHEGKCLENAGKIPWHEGEMPRENPCRVEILEDFLPTMKGGNAREISTGAWNSKKCLGKGVMPGTRDRGGTPTLTVGISCKFSHTRRGKRSQFFPRRSWAFFHYATVGKRLNHEWEGSPADGNPSRRSSE